MKATRKDIIVIVALYWEDIDFGYINRLISRGFVHLYPISNADAPVGYKCGLICAKKWVTEHRAHELYRGAKHGGPRKKKEKTAYDYVKDLPSVHDCAWCGPFGGSGS